MTNLTMQLPDESVWALAQFLKRASFSDYRQLAQNEEEAYEMQFAAEKLREALAEKGISPR